MNKIKLLWLFLRKYDYRWKVMLWTRFIFMRNKVFSGRYVDCLLQAKEWVKQRDIIVCSLIKEPTGKLEEKFANKDGIKRMFGKDNRMYTFTIVYVEDNLLVRALGYQETIDHLMIS